MAGRIESTITNCCTQSSREARLAKTSTGEAEIGDYAFWVTDFRKIREARGGMAHYGPHVAPPVHLSGAN